MVRINRIGLFLLLQLSFLSVFSQPYRFYISFTDKNNTPFSLSNPSQFLSQRAIDRRNAMGISIAENDLPVNPQYIDSVLSLPGTSLIHSTKWLNGISIYSTDSLIATQIQQFTFVQNVFRVKKTPVVNEKKYCDFFPESERVETDVDPYYGQAYNQIAMLKGNYLHNLGFTGSGKVIAILDVGFPNVENQDAYSRIVNEGRLLGHYDFVNMESQVSNNTHFHGTVVLSCIGSYLPGEQIGTAPDASFWLLVSENEFTELISEEDNWVVAAEFADSVGADIINSSLGYTTFDDSTQNHVYADLDGQTARGTRGAAIAASKGILVVNSAGNSGADAWHYLSVPADADSILAVGATDANGAYAFFSSTGPSADGRIKPDVSAHGWDAALIWPDGTLIHGSGTSFSSPIIAGMAACLWQAFPNATNLEIRDAIIQSSSQYSAPDSLLGFGIPDFTKAMEILAGANINFAVEDQFIGVYPNPFDTELYIDYFSYQSSSATVELFDVNGKKIFSQVNALTGAVINRITCSDINEDLPDGVYVVQVTTNSGVLTKKVIRF